MTELTSLSARALLDEYRARRLSPVEMLDAIAARIEVINPTVGAFIALSLDRARAEATAAEAAYRARVPHGALLGVPLAVKDMFDTAELRTTYGSRMFADHLPSSDAEAVRRARDAGAIVVGKTATHEFAWGITSVNPAMGTSHNPWASDRISGGSSGGSAVALGAGLVPLALGSDTGGSIRVPSSFCGTTGLKPTFGRVSRAGLWPLAPSLDHAGAMARTPADAELLLSVIAGHDRADAATLIAPRGLERSKRDGLAGLSVGVCPDLHQVPLAPDHQKVFDDAVRTIESLGARVAEVEIENAHLIHPTFVTIQRAEALHVHRTAGLFPSQRAEYGADVRAHLEAAVDVSLGQYLDAAAERDAIRRRFAGLFTKVDLLLTPTGAGSPVLIGENAAMHYGQEIPFRELIMTYTVPQSLAGLPVCVARAGFDDLGIPLGVQFTAEWWREDMALWVASAFVAATAPVQQRWPQPLWDEHAAITR
jgi:aspartyl-tRNA(Asn)/glutamyl-tRNA(Gln) amidotransferase subunit A